MILVGCQCDVGVRVRSISKFEIALLGQVLLGGLVEIGRFVSQCAIILLPEGPEQLVG